MANGRAPIPSNWTDYERGGRRGSSETLESHVQWGADVHDAPEHAAGSPDTNDFHGLRHRRCVYPLFHAYLVHRPLTRACLGRPCR
jgi:hypothetical protein